MKVVVIGGTGLIGGKVVRNLRARGHEAVAAAPNTGVNTLTGEGLDAVLSGAQVVVDVANSPSFDDAAVLAFFETSGRNLLEAETGADVQHHVALTIVGADRLPTSGYLRAKVAQEKLVEASGVPYTIVRSTQFFEFLRDRRLRHRRRHRAASLRTSPADRGPGCSGRRERRRPVRPRERYHRDRGPRGDRLADLVRRVLAARNDPRTVPR